MRIKFLSLLFLFFVTPQLSWASEMNVLCSTATGDWKWLHEYNHIIKRVKIDGVLVHKEQAFSLLNRHFYYFKTYNSFNDIDYLRKRCAYTFGPDYNYLQVAANIFSEWYLVGLSDNYIYPGFYSVHDYISEDPETQKIEDYFTPYIMSVGDIFLTK